MSSLSRLAYCIRCNWGFLLVMLSLLFGYAAFSSVFQDLVLNSNKFVEFVGRLYDVLDKSLFNCNYSGTHHLHKRSTTRYKA